MCLSALCKEHSPIPGQGVRESGVNSVIISKGCSIRFLLSCLTQCLLPHLADVDRCRWKNATISSGPFILVCRPWRSSAASLNESLKPSLEVREQCPSRQRGVQLSLGWHLQGCTLAQAWMRSSVTPFSKRSALLTYLVEVRKDESRLLPRGFLCCRFSAAMNK